jgi:predicted ATPase
LAELVAKSLVVADDVGHSEPQFRLLETTRAYTLAKLAESGESDLIARRLAGYCREFLEAGAQRDGAADD